MNSISRILIVSIFLIIFSLIYSKYIQAIEYPYLATNERASKIKTQFIKIKTGMTPHEVKEIMGEPDEIKDLYEPIIKNGKKIGYTYWYLIQRKANHGSFLEKDEKLVRISFDLKDTVAEIDHWGFEIEETR